MHHDTTDRRIGFEADGETLRVRDTVEGEELLLRADREFDPQPALTELFPFPVDRAVSFETGSISIPACSVVSVRDQHGEFIARLDEPMELPRGSYCFDVTGVTKALIRVTDVEVVATGVAGPDPVELRFDRPRTVTVGARSLHSRPEATITVPDDPTALAEAVSVLGSSIKEFSPERSWPTLRGYPPRIERGDELEIPSPLVVPDTGVEVVVRPTYADIYRLSTLSYYLGARLVVGDAPAVRLDTGYVETLPTDGVALEERVEELLRTWFFLDTLARTEGYIPSDRYEYAEVGAKLPFYPPKLADLSMSERLMEYLEVDSETVAPYAPDWPTEAVLRPTADSAALVPHLAHVLAPIRVRGAAEPPRSDAPNALATSPWLAPEGGVPDPDADPVPAGASVLTPTAYENRLRRPRTPRGEARVVAMVDSAERAEAIRNALSEPAVPEGIDSWTVVDRPDRETVTAVLGDGDVDVAYCGLPVERDRVVASDGAVALTDVATGHDAPALTVFEGTEDVAVGVRTVERGGIASVITEEPLPAARIRSLMGLLTFDLPLSWCVSFRRGGDATPMRLVGDPSVQPVVNQGLPVVFLSLESVSQNEYRTSRTMTLTASHRIGMEQEMLGDVFSNSAGLLGSVRREPTMIEPDALIELFTERDTILELDGELRLPCDGLTEEWIAESTREVLSEAATDESVGGEPSN